MCLAFEYPTSRLYLSCQSPSNCATSKMSPIPTFYSKTKSFWSGWFEAVRRSWWWGYPFLSSM